MVRVNGQDSDAFMTYVDPEVSVGGLGYLRLHLDVPLDEASLWMIAHYA